MPLPLINVTELFPEERASILSLLAHLSDDEWAMPTVCPGWSVKDIALHLLGDDAGMLSRGRDGFSNPHFADGLDISKWDDLLTAINRQNEIWVSATRRMSPRLLLQFLRITGEETADYVRTVDLLKLGGPVDWAGPDPAPAWLHVAREYTERWIHQQHIRDAVGHPGFMERRVFFPVLDAFCRALPHTLRSTNAVEGAVVKLVITGDAGGTWTVRRGVVNWEPEETHTQSADSTVTLDQDLAWRLFTKGITPAAAMAQIRIEGNRELASPLMQMVSILA